MYMLAISITIGYIRAIFFVMVGVGVYEPLKSISPLNEKVDGISDAFRDINMPLSSS